MFEIKDKIVLITGAAAGIGASVVRKLLAEDIKHVTILDIDKKNGFAIQEELNTKYGSNKVKFIKCDITKEQELKNAFRIVNNGQGYIDVVINNAGILNDDLFTKEIEINLTAVVSSSLQAWGLMRKDRGGSGGTIINIASIAAISTYSLIPVYSATKIAVVKFSTMLGDEDHHARTGVRILSICFGLTDTQIISKEKVRSFDPDFEVNIHKVFSSLTCQTTEDAARGLIEVYQNGKSGSVWIVANGEPANDVTEDYVRSTTVFDAIILK